MKWQKRLTKKELKHLREAGDVMTLRRVRELAEYQAQQRKLYPDIEPCFDCKSIMRKLEFPT